MHKLMIDDFDDEVYALIAIHCSIEDYRLAFLLNKHLGINFSRCERDVDFDYLKASFPIFEWEDQQHQVTWNLVANICKKEEESVVSSGSLFADPIKNIKSFNLIPEMEQVDFFIKIRNDGSPVHERKIVRIIQDIPQIAAVYTVDIFDLKSRENLIFD